MHGTTVKILKKYIIDVLVNVCDFGVSIYRVTTNVYTKILLRIRTK